MVTPGEASEGDRQMPIADQINKALDELLPYYEAEAEAARKIREAEAKLGSAELDFLIGRSIKASGLLVQSYRDRSHGPLLTRYRQIDDCEIDVKVILFPSSLAQLRNPDIPAFHYDGARIGFWGRTPGEGRAVEGILRINVSHSELWVSDLDSIEILEKPEK